MFLHLGMLGLKTWEISLTYLKVTARSSPRTAPVTTESKKIDERRA